MVDLYNREIVASAVSDRNDILQVTSNALDMALQFKNSPEGFIKHADRGSNFTANDYRSVLARRSIKISMNRKGNCWNKAVAQGFFATIKK